MLFFISYKSIFEVKYYYPKVAYFESRFLQEWFIKK